MVQSNVLRISMNLTVGHFETNDQLNPEVILFYGLFELQCWFLSKHFVCALGMCLSRSRVLLVRLRAQHAQVQIFGRQFYCEKINIYSKSLVTRVLSTNINYM